jgi:hypothetical protein
MFLVKIYHNINLILPLQRATIDGPNLLTESLTLLICALGTVCCAVI